MVLQKMDSSTPSLAQVVLTRNRKQRANDARRKRRRIEAKGSLEERTDEINAQKYDSPWLYARMADALVKDFPETYAAGNVAVMGKYTFDKIHGLLYSTDKVFVVGCDLGKHAADLTFVGKVSDGTLQLAAEGNDKHTRLSLPGLNQGETRPRFKTKGEAIKWAQEKQIREKRQDEMQRNQLSKMWNAVFGILPPETSETMPVLLLVGKAYTTPNLRKFLDSAPGNFTIVFAPEEYTSATSCSGPSPEQVSQP